MVQFFGKDRILFFSCFFCFCFDALDSTFYRFLMGSKNTDV